MERQRTPPGQRWTIQKKNTSTSLNLTRGLQIALILIPWIALFGVLFMQQRIDHQRQFETVEELKRAIVTEWQKLSQRFIDNSISEWRQRLEVVIKNGGGHI